MADWRETGEREPAARPHADRGAAEASVAAKRRAAFPEREAPAPAAPRQGRPWSIGGGLAAVASASDEERAALVEQIADDIREDYGVQAVITWRHALAVRQLREEER